MRPKLTALLLATLVALSAAYVVPDTTRVVQARSYSVICVIGVADRSTVVAASRHWQPQRLPSVFLTIASPGRTQSGFERSLYQRPPPRLFPRV